jgi:hypothetical protein
MLAFTLLGNGAISGGAQEATAVPRTTGDRVHEVLGALDNPSLAPGMLLELDRFTWMPGFSIQLHTHPCNDIYYVASGEIAWSVENGETQIQRAAVDGTPGPTETLMPGTEAILRAGDSIVFDYPPTNLLHAAHVVGEAPVVMFVAGVCDPNQTGTVFLDEMTPAPSS